MSEGMESGAAAAFADLLVEDEDVFIAIMRWSVMEDPERASELEGMVDVFCAGEPSGGQGFGTERAGLAMTVCDGSWFCSQRRIRQFG